MSDGSRTLRQRASASRDAASDILQHSTLAGPRASSTAAASSVSPNEYGTSASRRSTLSRQSTADLSHGAPLSWTFSSDSSSSSSVVAEDDETPFSYPLLDLLVVLDAHLELWTRSLRRKTGPWRTKADKLVDASKKKARDVVEKGNESLLKRVKSDKLLSGLLLKEYDQAEAAGEAGEPTRTTTRGDRIVFSRRDREKLETKLKEVRTRTIESMKKLSQKWEEEKTVRLRDKARRRYTSRISFFVGVMHVLASALLLGFAPTYIPLYYSLHFLFDLCYAINALCLVYIWILPGNSYLFQACYGLTLGSLGTAIATWRNSLVFHSLDKVISLAIHIFPPFVFTTIRHFYPNAEQRYPALSSLRQGLRPWHSIAINMVTYSAWQLAYYQFVIVARKEKIKQGRATSFTFLINDKKRLIGKIAAKVPEGKREFTFIAGQAVYTFVTLLIPIFVLFDSKFWSSVYLLALFGVSVWNGASFYLEVFSRRFEKELLALRKEFEEQQVQLLKYEQLAAVVDSQKSTSLSSSGGGDGSTSGQHAESNGSGVDMSRTTSTEASSSFGDVETASPAAAEEEEQSRDDDDNEQDDDQTKVGVSNDNSSGELVDVAAEELDKVAHPETGH
ncbi:hypothetical protein OIV83_004832 [Microbotryomycetes sp. JL201]|nr:hypothetical protein OIV83_004832 [Microbotryomycetes sp. JL201]